MGSRGPIPKRSSQRRRRNADSKVDTITMAGPVKVPPSRRHWHKIAKDWYRSLQESGQSRYFEPSDWAAAQYVAEVITRSLEVEVQRENPETGEIETVKVPRQSLNANLISGLWTMMGDLLTTEAARRRVRVEIERETGDEDDGPTAAVTALDDFRKLSGSG